MNVRTRNRLVVWIALAVTGLLALVTAAHAQAPARKPNILVIFGDDIGQTNISAYSFGVMGYKTPNIDRIAKEGMMFTDLLRLARPQCVPAPVRRLAGRRRASASTRWSRR